MMPKSLNRPVTTGGMTPVQYVQRSSKMPNGVCHGDYSGIDGSGLLYVWVDSNHPCGPNRRGRPVVQKLAGNQNTLTEGQGLHNHDCNTGVT